MKNELKVLKNHDWYTEVHPEKENYVFKVEETGAYDVTIQFNANNFEINVKTTKTGDAVIGEKTWTVVGFKAILGKNWDQTAIENDMIKQEDNVTYILTKTNLPLALGSVQTMDGQKTMVTIMILKVMPPFLLQETESTTSLSPSIRQPRRYQLQLYQA